MEWYTDWKFLGLVTLFIGNIVGQVGSIIASNSAKKVSTKIMNNDLKHLSIDIKELKKEVKTSNISFKKSLGKIWGKVNNLGKKQAARDAICEIRHKD